MTGPFFDDLAVNDVFAGAPPLTLTSGGAAVHQAILGDRLRLALDHRLTRAVAGQPSVAHPGLVWDVAIGQSTVVTPRVVANLSYRGLSLHRMPAIGDTLVTTTVPGPRFADLDDGDEWRVDAGDVVSGAA